MTDSANTVRGHQKKFEIGGVEYCVFDVNAQDAATSLNVTGSGTNGQYTMKAPGLLAATMTVQLYLNLEEENPYSDPPLLNAGEYLTNVKYYPDRDDATQFWHFPSALIVSAGEASPQDGAVVFSFSLESDGIYYKPVG